MAQLVECPTEKPGTILMWVRVSGAARDFPPRVHFQCRLSYNVSTDPVCKSDASTSVCTLKIPNSHTIFIVWTRENTALPGRNG